MDWDRSASGPTATCRASRLYIHTFSVPANYYARLSIIVAYLVLDSGIRYSYAVIEGIRTARPRSRQGILDIGLMLAGAY